jgi:hypothetical protein
LGIEATLRCVLCGFSRFNHKDSNYVVLKRVSIDEVLGNVRGFDEDVFKLLWGYVFSLRKFEDVLGSVNDFD